MKPAPTLRNLLLASTSLLALPVLHAADGTWTATAAGPFNWGDTTRWTDGIVADGADFTAFFTPNITANQNVTVDAARNIGNITFTDSTTNSNNLTIGGAEMLTLDVTTGASNLNPTQSGRTLTISAPTTINDGIVKNGAGALTFSGPITLGGSQTWTNSSAGAITTGNGANLVTNAGFDLTFDGTGVITLGVINNASATLSGSGNLIKNGSVRVNIGGVNSAFTGTITVNSGVLHVFNDNQPMGTGNVTLNGGVMSWYWGATYTRTLGTGTNQAQILGGESGFAGSGTTGPTINLGSSVVWGALGEGSATGYFNPGKFVLGDAGTGNAAATTFSSAIDLNSATRTILVPPGTNAGRNRSTISGRIFGTGNLVKEGAGWLFLTQGYSGTNVGWNGSTTVSQGMLDFTNANMANIGGGSGRNITVAAGSGVRFSALSNSILNRLVETTAEITVMTGTTGNSFDFSSSSGANLPNAFLGNFATNGAKMEYSGTLTPASDNYRLGSPSHNSGLLGMTNAAAMTGTQGLVIGGGSVQLVGAKTFSGDTLIRSGARLGLAGFNDGIAETDDSESLALQNSALDVGAAGGNFWFHKSTAVGPITGSANTTRAVFGGLIGSRNLSAVYSTTTGANNSAAQAVVDITGFTLNVAEGRTLTYSGNIGGFGTGASGGLNGASTLTKTGPGTQILTGTSTFSGGTTVTAGTLVAGSAGALGTGTVLVNGGTLRLDTVPTSGLITVEGTGTVLFGVDASAASYAFNAGGTLNLNGQTASTPMTLGSGSTITGTGTFTSATDTVSPDLRPGNGTGSLTITNTNLILGGVTHLEIGGTTGGTFDTVVGLGNINVVGDVNVTFLPGFTPAAGNTWDFFTEDGTFSSSADLNLPDLPEGLGWDSSTFATTGQISVVATGPILSASASVSSFSETAASPASVVTVTVSSAPVSDLVVTITADATEVTVPATVTILANQTSATFDVAAVNDGIADGNQVVAIGVSAAGYTAGSVNVTVTDVGISDPVAAYAGTFGLTGNDALPGADPDGDGISNAIEYALGISPAANNGPEYRGVATVSAGQLTLAFRRPVGGVGGVTYGLEFKNTDLDVADTGWAPGVLNTDYTENVVANGDGTETVTFTLVGAVTGKTFTRLKVTY